MANQSNTPAHTTNAPAFDNITKTVNATLNEQPNDTKHNLSELLARQRLAHSDSITTAITRLESIKAAVKALESVAFDNNPNFENSQEYTLFWTIEYLIQSYVKDSQTELQEIEQGV